LLGAGGGAFQPPLVFTVGSSGGLAVSDFNRDGKPDLAVGDYNAVAILLGLGEGAFPQPRTYPVLTNPTAVAAGDFDGDGKGDLAVANSGSKAVSIILGNGRTHHYPLPSAASTVAVGDFNGDGKLDLVAGSSILLGNGDGTFQPAMRYGFSAEFAIVGDFNGDGKPDLAVIDGEYYAVLLGNGDGTFQPPLALTVPLWTASFTVGDFNGDGKLDLAAMSTDNGGGGVSFVTVLLGNGDGSFRTGPTANLPYNSFATSAVAGDFNGDGKPDLAVPFWGSGSVAILLGNGDGSFQAKGAYSAGVEPTAAAVADFNGDGKQDVAVALWGSDTVVVLLGNGDGTFSVPPVSFGIGSLPQQLPQSMAVVDFNGDGKPDLALVDYPVGAVSLLTNTTP